MACHPQIINPTDFGATIKFIFAVKTTVGWISIKFGHFQERNYFKNL